MCGIVGIYRYQSGRKVLTSEIDAMNKAQQHRGPDGQGVFVEGCLGLGHVRLSIIDVSSRSNQPMYSANDQQVLVYNGEIYNYPELKQTYLADEVFQTESDTEVLLNLLRQQSTGALDHLNGMFAFAYWDKSKKSLLIARDQVGIKPLYYYEDDEGLYFASEIKAIRAVVNKKWQVNKKTLDAYISMGYVPGEESMFKGIKRLPAGHMMQVDQSGIKISSYWDLSFNRDNKMSEQQLLDKTESLLQSAVKMQLRADVPLGVFLSGGVDSSAVVSTMHELGVKNIKTFSVAWDYGKAYNETEYAREVSEQHGTEHHEFFMSAEQLWTFLPEYIHLMDEPVSEAAAISLYHIAQKTKEHVTVVLSGEGADEVFGGYPIYMYLHYAKLYGKLPKMLRKCMSPVLGFFGDKARKYLKLSSLPLEKAYAGVSFYEHPIKARLFTESFKQSLQGQSTYDLNLKYFNQQGLSDDQAKMQYLDFKTWLIDDLLIKADRMSMANGLELRVPFLDVRMLNFSGKIPFKYRFKNRTPKYLLKKIFKGKLSDGILFRKKQGFPTPLAQLFKEDLQDEVRAIIDSDVFYQRGYFKPDTIKQMLDEHFNNQKDHSGLIWRLIVLEQWHRQMIDAEISETEKVKDFSLKSELHVNT